MQILKWTDHPSNKILTTYLQSVGVFVSPTTTTFQPFIPANFFTSAVGGFTVVRTIHFSFISSSGGRDLRGILFQVKSTVRCRNFLSLLNVWGLENFPDTELWTITVSFTKKSRYKKNRTKSCSEIPRKWYLLTIFMGRYKWLDLCLSLHRQRESI